MLFYEMQSHADCRSLSQREADSYGVIGSPLVVTDLVEPSGWMIGSLEGVSGHLFAWASKGGDRGDAFLALENQRGTSPQKL